MKRSLTQIWKKFSIKRTSVMLLVLGLLREVFYLFKISLNKSKRITFKKTQIISEKYEILQPEELIKYVKYYASTNTSWYPNWQSKIDQYSKIPDLLLIDTIEKIQYSYERKIYLEWLINELSNYPVTGTFDIHEVGYFRDFKRLALDKYELCFDQGNKHEVNNEKQSKAIIQQAIKMTCLKKGENCSIVLKKYAAAKTKYPSIDRMKIYEGYREFDGLTELVKQSTYYYWINEFDKNKKELIEINTST